MLVTRERGYIWMLRYRHPSWFLSVGAESAAQHSTILATLVAFCREVMHGDHEISFDQLKFESPSTIQPARGLDATTRL